VTLDELRAEAVWLERCWGCLCPWPIATARDLRDFASAVLDPPPDDLTVGEVRRIEKLIESLKPPESRAEVARRKKKEARRAKKELANGVDPRLTPLQRAFGLPLIKTEEEKWRPWQTAGARARTKKSKRTVIISHWQKLSHLPLHARAAAVAVKHGVTSHYVRRVIRTARLRLAKIRTNQL
jgi:hypothetical protein